MESSPRLVAVCVEFKVSGTAVMGAEEEEEGKRPTAKFYRLV